MQYECAVQAICLAQRQNYRRARNTFRPARSRGGRTTKSRVWSGRASSSTVLKQVRSCLVEPTNRSSISDVKGSRERLSLGVVVGAILKAPLSASFGPFLKRKERGLRRISSARRTPSSPAPSRGTPRAKRPAHLSLRAAAQLQISCPAGTAILERKVRQPAAKQCK